MKLITLYRAFELVILILIILNSLVLAIYDYSDREENSSFNQVLSILNSVFSILFGIEAFVKIVAMGFIWD